MLYNEKDTCDSDENINEARQVETSNSDMG